MAQDEIDHRVIEFVTDKLGAARDQVCAKTTLFGDLGVDGDDAVDFFSAFSEKFHVDLSALDLSVHFGGEGWLPGDIPLLFYQVFRKLFLSKTSRKTPEERAGFVPITVGNLVASVKTGRWN